MKNKKVIVNFKDVLSELEQKKIKFCFLREKGLYVVENFVGGINDWGKEVWGVFQKLKLL
ncbi:hypothetical protein WGM54_14120 [Paenibacillus polymyxa]|uniref:hypothetical protein n=1 Tax=Paenibacillus polymyxa TaxID=1406 RepID=UPI00307E94DA